MQDQVMPQSKWSFDGEVTAVFDDMLARSIPQYGVIRRSVFDLACQYVQPGTDIVDLGCSRGEAMALLVDRFGAQNRFIGVEVSQPMLEAARARFAGGLAAEAVEILELDLRTAYPPANASVTLAILSIQFTPIEYRQRILRDVFRHTVSGGAFILVEKVLGNCSEIDEAMIRAYYGMKTEHGYSQEQIERKRLSLEGVLVPVTAHWNEDLLRTAGFSHVDCFWRWMNFAGWVAIKE